MLGGTPTDHCSLLECHCHLTVPNFDHRQPFLLLLLCGRSWPSMVGKPSSSLAERAEGWSGWGVGAAREWKIGLHFCTRSAALHLCSCICNFPFLARPKEGLSWPG